MIQTAAISILSLLASVFLTLAGWGMPVALLHLAFAVGIVPLIFAAMGHFVPVLTRTGDAELLIRRLPLFAQMAGLLAVAAMNASLPRSFLHLAAAVDLVLALVLLRWILRRAKACLGPAHPGWRWYALGLLCLMLALCAVPILLAWPAAYFSLRSLHLHLNTLGLVGFAAFGTLPVLLPTALGRPDPGAAGWLRRCLWPMLAAVSLIVLGAALFWPLSVAGAAILLLLVGSLLHQWQQTFGWQVLAADGAAFSLLAATVGLGLLALNGALHGAGFTGGQASIHVWALAFMLPLVTGALSQLLPVWCLPGPASPARLLMRQKMVTSGIWRGVLFLATGLALTAGFSRLAVFLLLPALVLFVIALLQAVRVLRSTR